MLPVLPVPPVLLQLAPRTMLLALVLVRSACAVVATPRQQRIIAKANCLELQLFLTRLLLLHLLQGSVVPASCGPMPRAVLRPRRLPHR